MRIFEYKERLYNENQLINLYPEIIKLYLKDSRCYGQIMTLKEFKMNPEIYLTEVPERIVKAMAKAIICRVHSLGGCDAFSYYDKGWDAAIKQALSEVEDLTGYTFEDFIEED